MKGDAKLCSDIRKEYNEHFKTGKIQYRSFHDLLWQIAINGMLDNEDNEPVSFHVDVTGKFGNQLVLAYSSGGYKNTGVYFVSSNYNECCDIAEKINERFFKIDKEEQMRLINKSMFSDAK